jgi:Mrp family chromosome partitioning ATPase
MLGWSSGFRRSPDRYSSRKQYSVPAEVVSGLRHMLTRMVTTGQWPRPFALTSALRQEGVSYTALALSAVLSQDTTMPVCLVDTNWYWPSVPVVDSPGLAAVLDGELRSGPRLAQVER